MRTILAALTLAALAIAPAGASETTDVMSVLHQFVDGFNKGGDMKPILAACADETSIIDDFPPNEWHGAGGCARWLSDFIASNKTDGVTDGFITLGKARHVDISTDHAYVVAPLSFTFKMKGNPMKANGSIWTVALKKGPSGWRIIGWSYSAGVHAAVDPVPGS